MITCTDCQLPATTNAFAGRAYDGSGISEPSWRPVCERHAVEALRDREELRTERQREWWDR